MNIKLTIAGIAAVALCVLVILVVRRHDAAERHLGSSLALQAKIKKAAADFRGSVQVVTGAQGEGSDAGQKRHDAAVGGASTAALYDYTTQELDAANTARDALSDANDSGNHLIDLVANSLGDSAADKARSDLHAWNESKSNALDAWIRAIQDLHDSMRERLNGRWVGSGDIEAYYAESDRDDNLADLRMAALDADVSEIGNQVAGRVSIDRKAAATWL